MPLARSGEHKQCISCCHQAIKVWMDRAGAVETTEVCLYMLHALRRGTLPGHLCACCI